MIWLYFLMATFILQVIFFNLLVSVIGEYYTDRYANKEKYALQQRNLIFNDFITTLKMNPMSRFLYIVKPSEEETEPIMSSRVHNIEKRVETIQDTLEYIKQGLDKLQNKEESRQ